MIMIYGGIIYLITAIVLFLLGGCSTWIEAARDNYFGALLSLLLSIILFILSYYDK